MLRLVHSRSLTDGLPDMIIEEFRTGNPDVDVHVDTAWTARNIEMVRDGQAEAAFVRLPLSNVTDRCVLPLGATEIVIAVPSMHPLARHHRLRFADLTGERVVSWPRLQAPEYLDYLPERVGGQLARVVVLRA